MTCARWCPTELVRAHRGRALSPEQPFIRGTAQNPDVYFQARETVNPFYAAVPQAVQDAMDGLAARTGRRYRIMDYSGHPEAERVIVVMGSAAQTAAETVAHLAPAASGSACCRCGCSGRSRPGRCSTRCPPPPAGSRSWTGPRSPAPMASRSSWTWSPRWPRRTPAASARSSPCVTGGRYGLSSKELTPAMVAGVFAELAREQPRRRFTIGITDDVSGTSLPYDPALDIEPPGTVRAVFFGLGSDGTVGANKNTIKILGAEEGLHAQGYFVYDSKKSGSQTVSHLRFGPQPIRAPYLVEQASFVGCHQFGLLERVDVLGRAAPGATLLLELRAAAR